MSEEKKFTIHVLSSDGKHELKFNVYAYDCWAALERGKKARAVEGIELREISAKEIRE